MKCVFHAWNMLLASYIEYVCCMHVSCMEPGNYGAPEFPEAPGICMNCYIVIMWKY